MLKYSHKSRATVIQTIEHLPLSNDYSHSDLYNPRASGYKPPGLIMPKRDNNQNVNDIIHTPKTARPTYEYSRNNASFNKSIHVTPDKQSSRKDASFIVIRKSRDQNLKDFVSKLQNDTPQKLEQGDRTQRTARPFKSKTINVTDQELPGDFKLRQTISNLTGWQYKNIIVPNQSKTSRQTPQEKEKEDPLIMKKKEEDYSTLTKSQNLSQNLNIQSTVIESEVKKETLSKYSSKNHSRNNSQYQDKLLIQPLILKTRASQIVQSPVALKTSQITQHTNKTPKCLTPRSSQQKLTKSTHLGPKQKVMNQTDPSFFQRQTLTKRATSFICKSKETALQLKVQDFQLGPCKGQGRFGKVFPAIHKKTGILIGLKKILKESVRLMLEQFIMQIKISLFLSHPNVVKMYGFFTDTLNFYIIMEYMEEGSLYKPIKLSKRLPEEEVSTKLFQICEAVKYLHINDILHRDIKPENIVLTNGVCKLCDFGWATYSKQRRNTYCGTLDYVCPQILQGESYDNFVDIWAIGVLAYQMLTGKAPFYHISRKETMKSIMKCDFSFPVDMSVDAKMFIRKALRKDPDERFTIQFLLKDKFVSQGAIQF